MVVAVGLVGEVDNKDKDIDKGTDTGKDTDMVLAVVAVVAVVAVEVF